MKLLTQCQICKQVCGVEIDGVNLARIETVREFSGNAAAEKARVKIHDEISAAIATARRNAEHAAKLPAFAHADEILAKLFAHPVYGQILAHHEGIVRAKVTSAANRAMGKVTVNVSEPPKAVATPTLIEKMREESFNKLREND